MSVPRQLTMGMMSAHRNQYLFSDHYLDHLLPADPRWPAARPEAKAFVAWLQALYAQEEAFLPHYNESQLEDHWFRPILARLGHVYEGQAGVPGLDAGVQRPDYVFFPDQAARQAAASLQNKETYAANALAVGEVKRWDVPLGKKQRGGGASFEAQNPSWQIDYYLRATGLDWGLLSNGRLWRLVHRETSQRLSIYYEVDLVDLLQRGDAGAMCYLTLFFQQVAFRPDAQGRLFLQDALDASTAYAVALEEDLEANVYQALERLMQGFLDLPQNGLGAGDLRATYENSLLLLYRLLFILYGESRGLLPLHLTSYRDHYSLDHVKREIAHLTVPPAPMTTLYWGRIVNLFQIINGDNVALNRHLGVPRYNGGLFDPALHPFLETHAVGDRALVEAIDLLSRRTTESGREFVDYRTLGVRHLGSIYEGLLEYRPRYAAAPTVAIRERNGERWVRAAEVPGGARVVERRAAGQVYLETDKGERKATGSYYTPQYIVAYIVEHTLGPLVKDAVEQVKARGREARERAARAPGAQPPRYDAGQALIDEILNLKVLDPAMGSAHFLVEATEYLALALATDPYVETEAPAEEDLVYWRRRVVERCIYGVDVNPLAVELAKLSLWLATVAEERPLSFLDHHLRCGDSLIGARVADLGWAPPVLLSKKAQRQLEQQKAGQINMFEYALSQRLPVVMGRIMEITEVESDSYDTVQAKEAADQAVRALKAPFEAVADLWTSAHFGHAFTLAEYGEALERIGQPDELLAVPAVQRAREMAAGRRFFHWELAFPEVFYDRHGQPLGDRAGFDAAIGNPPYVSAWSMTDSDASMRLSIVSLTPSGEALSGHWDLYIPFLLKSHGLCRQNGRFSLIIPNPFCREKYAMRVRKFLLEQTQLERLAHFDEENVFESVSRHTVIPIFSKSIPSQSSRIQIDDSTRVQKRISDIDATSSYVIPQSAFWQFPEYQIRYERKAEWFTILTRVNELSWRLGDICYVNYGAQVSSKNKGEFGKSDVISCLPIGNAKKFFDGKTLSRYEIQWDGRYLDYRPQRMYGPRATELFESPKIVVRDVTGANEQLIVSYDDAAFYCDHLVICSTYYENVEGTELHTSFEGFTRLSPPYPDLLYITGILASKLVTWYFREVFATGTLQGSYSHTYPQQIRSFPVRCVVFHTPSELRQQLAQQGKYKAEESVQALVASGALGGSTPMERAALLAAAGPALSFVDARLSAQPEQADVVHDLLAHLAEQMIAMHKEKQTLIEAFWLDLEGVTDAGAFEVLRTKGKWESTLWKASPCRPFVGQESRSTRTLDESLGWSEEAFKAFVKALVPRVAGMSDLVAVYRAHAPACRDLSARIAATDWLIDQIVYRLYGLTRDEIAIVEGHGR